MSLDKLGILLKQRQKLFHTGDLGLLWQIANRNTLYTTISRLVNKGVLIPIHKGLYSVVPVTELEPVELGLHVLHRPAYLSTESVLARMGLISQMIYPTTFVSDISKRFQVATHEYLVRRLQPVFLHNTTGIVSSTYDILIASPSRAVADLMYFQPTYHFDARNQIDWDEVNKIRKEVGYI